MSLVIALKVGDGVVLGADSASTYSGVNGDYVNSYFNAEKLFNLAKGLPIGVVTCGLGGLADRSISSHMKDLRSKVCDTTLPKYYLDPQSFTVGDAAASLRAYFYEDLYSSAIPKNPKSPVMIFMVAGYSAGSRNAEVWQVTIQEGGTCDPAVPIIPASQPCGAQPQGITEACYRLLFGWSPQILDRLKAAGIPEADAITLLTAAEPMIHPTMPLQDAIDFVDYLAEVTCGYVRFAPGPAVVAKPIDTAAITPHEGFRWIHRKHYYPRELNLPHPTDDG